MDERPESDSVVRDGAAMPDEQTPHERRVADAEAETSAGPTSPALGGSANRYTGSQAEPYEDEVKAERRGTTADEVQEEQDEPEGKGEAARWYTG